MLFNLSDLGASKDMRAVMEARKEAARQRALALQAQQVPVAAPAPQSDAYVPMNLNAAYAPVPAAPPSDPRQAAKDRQAALRSDRQAKLAAQRQQAALRKQPFKVPERPVKSGGMTLPNLAPPARPKPSGGLSKVMRPGYKPGLTGLGDTYSNWYYNTYLPMLLKQQQQRCPTGYTLQQQASGAVCVPTQQPWYYNQQYQSQYNPYQQQQYNYGQQQYNQQAIGYMTAQQCVAQGGIYDSFTGLCSRPGAAVQQQQYYYGQQQYNYAYGAGTAQQCVSRGGLWDSFTGQCSTPGSAAGTATGTMPNVLGMEKWTAVQQLNNAGYAVWLLQENGISQGTPTDYNAKRVQIVVYNGVVTNIQNG